MTRSQRSCAADAMCGASGSSSSAWPAWRTGRGAVDRRLFPPQVRAEVIRLACERPAQSDVPLARAVGGGAAIEQLRAECVPGSEVTQGAASLILVLDALAALDGRRGGQRGVLAVPRLDRGFLIAADDVVAGMQ